MAISEKIAVTGATGQLGRLVIADLLRLAPDGSRRSASFATRRQPRTLRIAASNFALPITTILLRSRLRLQASTRCF